MIQDTFQELFELLEKYNSYDPSNPYNPPTNELAAAVRGDEKRMWDYLVSNELWGGAGSIADQAFIEIPEARAELQKLMIRLGREQMSLGRVNVRTDMWVSAFQKWQDEGMR